MFELVPTAQFRKSFKLFRRKHPDLLSTIDDRLELLRKDPNNYRLRSHKLKGNLAGCMAASITYQYRLVFVIERKRIYLLAIGTHDEVY